MVFCSNLKRYVHPNVHGSTVNNRQDRKQPECPLMDACVKKTWQIYLKWTIRQSEKDKILAFATTWVNFENARERKTNTV